MISGKKIKIPKPIIFSLILVLKTLPTLCWENRLSVETKEIAHPARS